MTLAYNVSDFQQIFHQYEKECKLENDVLSVLQYLEDNIIIPDETEYVATMVTTPRYHNHTDSNSYDRQRRPPGGSRRGGSGGGNIPRTTSRDSNVVHSAQEWADIKNFKVTQIKTSEGIEKEINEIRSMLNKLSAKNYETMKETILQRVKEVLQLHEDNEEEQLQVIGSIVDIACANKFLSQLYANFFTELYSHTSLCDKVLSNYMQKYKDSTKNIHYVDSNVDYDGFCIYNKTNDSRKALITFFIYLMQNGLIPVIEILQIVMELQDMSREYIGTENRVNEVDEITENIAVIVKLIKEKCREDELWRLQIHPSLIEFSKMKSKDYKSLSMRTVFKYMDLI